MFSRLHRSLVVAAAAILLLAPAASAQPSNKEAEQKVDRGLREALRHGGSTQPVILMMRAGCRADVRKALEQHGDKVKAEHPLIDGLSIEIHSGDVDELAKSPCIQAVAWDGPISTNAYADTWQSVEISSSPQPVANTLRDTLGLPHIATSGTMTGATGVAVAIIDSGIAPNADFTGRIVGFYDFTKGGISTAPYDDYGHGTHIAGLIGSSGKLSNYEFQGVAPEVNMIGLKVLDATGQGKTSDVISALEFVTAKKDRLNVKIVNLSLGHPIYAPAKYDPLVLAVEKASDAGLIVVVSAGNYGQYGTNEPGYTGVTSPGNAPSAITVGAAVTQNTTTRDDDAVTSYSSRGPTWFDAFPKPDVVAPGHQLLSDASLTSYLYKKLQANHGQSANGQQFLQLSGTSMAAAVTSGVVALALQQHNQNGLHRQKLLTPNLVKAMLQFSAIPVAAADALTQGAGEVNAAGAIALAKVIDTSVRLQPGDWQLSSGVSPYSTIGNQTFAWSQQVIWGDDALTGDVLYYNSTAWSVTAQWGDDNIVWGTSVFTADDNIVWGTTAVWASNLVWPTRVIGQMDDSDNIVWGTNDNIVWGTLDDDNIVWGTWDGDNIIWGTWDGDNIVWGTDDDNIVWGTDDNIVWGTDDNIIWGTDDNIIWGTSGVF